GITHPTTQVPRLEGVDGGPVAWTLHVPVGYQLAPVGASTGQSAHAPASAAGLYLRRAACQYQLSSILAGSMQLSASAAVSSLALAQRRFYRACDDADRSLATLGEGGDSGPDGQSLEEWSRSLQEQNRQLARQHGFEALRAEAKRQATAGQRDSK